MSIIETAYAETIAARLCDRIAALDVATAAYQTTGDDLAAAIEDRTVAAARLHEAETTFRSAAYTRTDLGPNEKAREATIKTLMQESSQLADLRGNVGSAEYCYLLVERAHKNAYHEMESLRVAINAFAAVLGATHDR